MVNEYAERTFEYWMYMILKILDASSEDGIHFLDLCDGLDLRGNSSKYKKIVLALDMLFMLGVINNKECKIRLEKK